MSSLGFYLLLGVCPSIVFCLPFLMFYQVEACAGVQSVCGVTFSLLPVADATERISCCAFVWWPQACAGALSCGGSCWCDGVQQLVLEVCNNKVETSTNMHAKAS